MAKKRIGVGQVGFGFIGQVHTLGYRSLPLYYNPMPAKVELVGISDLRESACQQAIEAADFLFASTDYHDLLQRDDIDLIDCSTPNSSHKAVLIDAMRAGKNVYCEKPLAMHLADAREILRVARQTGVRHQMTFEYRFIPAIMRARQLIDEGFLGRVFHFRARYLHAGYVDATRPVSWRLDKREGGGGAVYDLGAHVIDLLTYLLGEVQSVFATTETFIKERPVAGQPGVMKDCSDVDELVLMQLRMKDGSLGVMEASRVATGANDDLKLEVHGSKGAIAFSLMQPNYLGVYDNTVKDSPIGGERGFKWIETVQRYPAPAVLPSPKFAMGWMRSHFASQFALIKYLADGDVAVPTFEQGVKVQEIMEACYLSSHERAWVDLPLD